MSIASSFDGERCVQGVASRVIVAGVERCCCGPGGVTGRRSEQNRQNQRRSKTISSHPWLRDP